MTMSKILNFGIDIVGWAIVLIGCFLLICTDMKLYGVLAILVGWMMWHEFTILQMRDSIEDLYNRI